MAATATTTTTTTNTIRTPAAEPIRHVPERKTEPRPLRRPSHAARGVTTALRAADGRLAVVCG